MKSELRKKLKERRDSLVNKQIYSEKITDLLLASSFYKEAETVLLYSSSGSEVPTNEIYKACLKDKKRIAFPLCIDKNGIMDFFIVDSENDLTDGVYGIKAPSEWCKRLIDDERCLCVVPGIAFDTRGYRLGYGKGYYDRYLENFTGVSVGLCYSELLNENLPADIYDKKVNYLITDKTIYKINSKEDLKNG